MRHPILKKTDTFTHSHAKLDPNVVELPEMVSVWWNHDFGDIRGPYGTITDLRVEDGELTGELNSFDPTWNDNTMEDINCRLAGYFTDVAWHSDLDGSNAVITKCALRAVSVIMEPPFGANPFPKES